MNAVVVERQRIDDPAARKGEPSLVLQPRDSGSRPHSEAMACPIEESGFEKLLDVSDRDGPIGDAAGRRFDLDHRLEPEQAMGAVAHDADVDAAPPRTVLDGPGDG